MENITIGVVIVWIICGIITAFMGSVKGRSGCGWFFAGFLLGPIGIIIAAIIKRKEPQPEIKLTVNYPNQKLEQKSSEKFYEAMSDSENREEHLKALLHQATTLKDTDIDTAIRIVREVIREYKKQNEPFVNLKPVYFKLAYYLQKKGDRNGAWKIYNEMILEAIEQGHYLILGMDLADIYSRMALMAEREARYKDAIFFKIQSFINKNEALHLQARKKELIPIDEIIDKSSKLAQKVGIESWDQYLSKRLKPLLKQFKRGCPAKEPFLLTPKKETKIKNRYIFLNNLAKKQLNLIRSELRNQKKIGITMS